MWACFFWHQCKGTWRTSIKFSVWKWSGITWCKPSLKLTILGLHSLWWFYYSPREIFSYLSPNYLFLCQRSISWFECSPWQICLQVSPYSSVLSTVWRNVVVIETWATKRTWTTSVQGLPSHFRRQDLGVKCQQGTVCWEQLHGAGITALASGREEVWWGRKESGDLSLGLPRVCSCQGRKGRLSSQHRIIFLIPRCTWGVYPFLLLR